MIIARMQTEHYDWMAAGATKPAAMDALADGFCRWLVKSHADGFDLAEYLAWTFGEGEDEPDLDLQRLKAVTLEYYGAFTYKMKSGECLMDGGTI